MANEKCKECRGKGFFNTSKSSTYKETKDKIIVNNNYYGVYEGYKARDNMSIGKTVGVDFVSVYSTENFDAYSFSAGMLVRSINSRDSSP